MYMPNFLDGFDRRRRALLCVVTSGIGTQV
jgi:hypothetical protein